MNSAKQPPPILQDLSVTAQAWSQFDLDSRRPLLDQAATQCHSARDQSLAARKNLSEITKKFKRCVKACETSLAAHTALGGDNSTDKSSNIGEGEIRSNIDTLTSQCRTIVKAYQEEIDALTRRSKASDAGFLNLYQSIYELPDPSIVLRPLLDFTSAREDEVGNLMHQIESLMTEVDNAKMANDELKKTVEELEAANTNNNDNSNSNDTSELNEEIIALRKEVAEYELEFRGLKNQDITIRKLEAKIAKLQKESQQEISETLKKAKEQLAETEGRRATEALEREAIMERKLESLELELRAERAGRRARDVQDLDDSEGEKEREAAWEAQRQILVDDSERLRELLYDVQRERDDLRLKLDMGVGGLGNQDAEGKTVESSLTDVANPSLDMQVLIAERKAYEAEVSELSLTAASLRDELKLSEDKLKENQTAMQEVIESLQNERSGLTQMVATLQTQLANVPSQSVVDNMKRELRILKRLEYNAEDQDMDMNHDNDEYRKDPEMTTDTSNSISDDLESVLVSRLRKVEGDLLKEKREKTESLEKCRSLEKEVASLQEIKISNDKLISSLEADLSKAIPAPPTAFASSNVPIIPLHTGDTEPVTLQQIIDPNAPAILKTQDSSTNTPSTPTSLRTPSSSSSNLKTALEKSNDDHSVATIVMAQRDRLRARCDALEAERDSFKKELQVQVRSAESLKADNTKLYEKVRYLQNFSQSSNTPYNRASSYSTSNRDHDLDLEALEERYEASVDPFRQFGRAERARKLKEMTHLERFVFISAKFVLGSKQMRTALVVYVMSMHFLVFITTYHWAHEKSCPNLELHPLLEHMHGGPPLDETLNRH